MMTDMRVKIAGVELKNPVMTASGTFGSGQDLLRFFCTGDPGCHISRGALYQSLLQDQSGPGSTTAYQINGILVMDADTLDRCFFHGRKRIKSGFQILTFVDGTAADA